MILNDTITALKLNIIPTTKQKTFILPKGKLNDLQLIIPTGHVGLTETVFYYQGHQIFPLISGNFKGNGTHIKINPGLRIDTQPRELKVILTNYDDTYEHSIYVILEIDTTSNEGLSIQELISLSME